MTRTRIIAAGMMMLIAMPTAVLAQTLPIEGQVTKIDAGQNKITLRHGPIEKLDMDVGMTMVFRVKDPSLLGKVKVGDKVTFDAEHTNGQYIVTAIEKAK